MTQRATDDRCERPCDALQQHLRQDERRFEVLARQADAIKCLSETMKVYQEPLRQIVVMLPEIKEVLTRNSQAKAIFWFIVILSGVIATLAGAVAGIVHAFEWLRGLK